ETVPAPDGRAHLPAQASTLVLVADVDPGRVDERTQRGSGTRLDVRECLQRVAVVAPVVAGGHLGEDPVAEQLPLVRVEEQSFVVAHCRTPIACALPGGGSG